MDNVIEFKNNGIQQLCKSFGYKDFGDVMVVGGGISGIQAALDLGTTGFKVYCRDPGDSRLRGKFHHHGKIR
jgi:heterodisulfide reductase subunit A-like polyferredoxin